MNFMEDLGKTYKESSIKDYIRNTIFYGKMTRSALALATCLTASKKPFVFQI